jgi:hypothetical protein
MSRAALLCCTALALVLGTGAAHGADKPNPVCFKLTEYSQDQDPFGFGAMFQSLDLMIDCSWLKWAIQYVEHHDPLTERLARESKPLSDRLIEQNQDRPPPMSPRGTFPPLTVVNNDWGGRLHEYEARWQQVAIGGGPVEIMGWCVSGCTLLAAYIPKERLCFGEGRRTLFPSSTGSKRW